MVDRERGRMSASNEFQITQSVKGRPFCYLCNNRTALSARNAVKIFNVTANTTDGTTLADILSSILQRPINEENAHSHILCKKCQGICSEYQDALSCLNNVRDSIITTFKTTATKLNIQLDVDETEIEQLDNDECGLFSVGYDGHSEESEANVFEEEIVTSGKQMQTSKIPSEVVVYNEDDVKPKRKRIDKNVYTMNDMILSDVSDAVEYAPQETHEAIIISDSVIDGGEYFDGNESQMIEISTEVGDKEEDYETTFVFDNDVNIVEGEETMENEQTIIDENSMDKGLSTSTVNVKAEMDDSLNSMDDEKGDKNDSGDGMQQTPIFMREGMNFKCQLCYPANNVVYDAKTIAIHMKSDHYERIYVCDICGADFRKRNVYNDHMDDHSSEGKDGEYRCGVCEGEFNNSRQLRLHKKTHSMCVKIWSCKECNKNYSSKNLLDEHMNMHTGDRPYKCPHCTKDFASKYTLTAHMKTHYERKRPYECKECNKSFFSNQNLTQHERTHSGIKEYICEICNKAFGTPHNLDVHKIVHTGHKPFICRTCGKAFARRAEIKDHERTHTGERPYKCEMCSASFAQRSNLMSHKRATHFDDKRYKCDTCDRSFKRRRLLEYHIRASHTGERPYRCDICGSTFVYPEHYKKHVRIHSGVKPFTCEVCGKAFNSRDNRNAHRFVHSDKKPYECLVCGIGFMRKPLLYAHMQTQNHVNDTIVINQPRIGGKMDDRDNGVVYVNVNPSELMEEDDSYNPFEEEHIIEEGEIIHEEDLIIDNPVQFTTDSQNAIEHDGQADLAAAGNDSLYITENVYEDDGEDNDDSTKKVTNSDDTIQYKYVYLNKIGTEVMPM